MKKIILLVLFVYPLFLFSQQFADKNYYLVDSLILEEFGEDDRFLLDSCLNLYHASKHDTDKINALYGICEGMFHEDWGKYQLIHYELVQKTLNELPKDSKNDKLRHKLFGLLSAGLNNIGYINMNQSNFELALDYYQKSVEIKKQINDKIGEAITYSNIGLIYEDMGNMSKAEEYHLKGFNMSKELNDTISIAIGYLNLGSFYTGQGNIAKGLEYTHESLKFDEKRGDLSGMATGMNNLGFIYFNQGDPKMALKYFHQSLELREKIGDRQGIAMSLNSIANVYRTNGIPDCEGTQEECTTLGFKKSLEYFTKSLEIRRATGDKKGEALCLDNIGIIYQSNGDPHFSGNKEEALKTGKDKAYEYFLQSLKIQEEIGYSVGISVSLYNLSQLLIEKGQYEQAKEYAIRSLEIAKELGSPKRISMASSSLKDIYKKQGNYMEALNMYELHIQMRDSINNQETQKATIRQQTQYEFEKAQLVKEQEEKEAARIEQEEKERKDNIQYSMIFLGILLVFGVVLSSGKFNISPKFAEGLIFFAFLLFFEFCLVLLDPIIDDWSSGEPIYKLLFNAVLAGAIFPLHAFFEKLLKKRLIKIE
jgi:tetratricopeptide (TPR) repeat protein